MSSPWLTPAEVHELTDKTRWKAQCKALTEMGMPFRPNAVGRPLVERAVVLTKSTTKSKPKQEPNWDGVRGKAA